MPLDTGDWSKFWDLIKDIKFGMFTARHGDGHLHSRPMTTLNGRDERTGVIWFFMSRTSEPALDIASSADVNVAYADPGHDAYVSVSGSARIVNDMATKKPLCGPL